MKHFHNVTLQIHIILSILRHEKEPEIKNIEDIFYITILGSLCFTPQKITTLVKLTSQISQLVIPGMWELWPHSHLSKNKYLFLYYQENWRWCECPQIKSFLGKAMHFVSLLPLELEGFFSFSNLALVLSGQTLGVRGPISEHKP